MRQRAPERVLGPYGTEVSRPSRGCYSAKWQCFFATKHERYALQFNHPPPVPVPRLRPGENRQGICLTPGVCLSVPAAGTE